MAEKNGRAPQMEEEQDMSEILRVRREKLRELQESGNDPYQITKYPVDNDSATIKANFDQLEGKPVSIAGRMMSKRGMGKVSFCDLQDRSGRIQLYARKDEMGEEDYNRFKKYDIGDILGVQGVVFRTQRGEMSAPSGSTWTATLSWRWRPLCCTTRQAAPRPGPSSPITTHWTSTCTCASRWSCT